MSPFSAQIQDAIAELTRRTKREIEAETAWRWAARAAAAVRLANTDRARQLRWIAVAVEYGHEAIEHAAVAGFEVLNEIQAQLAIESPPLFGDE